MTTISIYALKGGVGKTMTAIVMAYILAVVYGFKVLLADNDKQGNTSHFYGCHSYDHLSMADIIAAGHININKVIRHSKYENIDIIPANMNLLDANMEAALDTNTDYRGKLKEALEQVHTQYDFCIIDNATDMNVSMINAMVASDQIVVPVKIDDFSFDGVEELLEQVENVKKGLNPRIELAGCLITCFQKIESNIQGAEQLRKNKKYKVFENKIRFSGKVDGSTFARIPIVEYSPRSAAAVDYKRFVQEYIEKCVQFGHKRGGQGGKG